MPEIKYFAVRIGMGQLREVYQLTTKLLRQGGSPILGIVDESEVLTVSTEIDVYRVKAIFEN